jgi:hypothetical protein
MTTQLTTFGVLSVFYKSHFGSDAWYGAFKEMRKAGFSIGQYIDTIIINPDFRIPMRNASAFFHNIKFCTYVCIGGQIIDAYGFNMTLSQARAQAEAEGLCIMSMDEWNNIEDSLRDY